MAQRPEVGDFAVASGEGDSYLLLHQLQYRPRQERGDLHVTKKIALSSPIRQGRSDGHLWDALLSQIFMGTQDSPCLSPSSPSPGRSRTPSSAPAEEEPKPTSCHRVCGGWVSPHTTQRPLFLERGLAGDSTTKQGAALRSICTKHGICHVRVHDRGLRRWSGVLNRLRWSPRHTAAGPLCTNVMGQWGIPSM